MAINNSILLSITAIIFISLFLFIIGLMRLGQKVTARRRMINKIQSGGYGLKGYDVHSGAKRPSESGVIIQKIFEKIGTRVRPQSNEDYSSIRMLRAGIDGKNAATVFWGVKLFFVITLPAVFFCIREPILHLTLPRWSTFIGVMLAISGLYAPDLWIFLKTGRRKQELRHSLPDSLDLMVVCVESGMGVDSAFNRVAKEIRFSDPELSRELTIMNHELRAGMARRDALKNLAMRINIDEINNFTSLLIQADKFGTSIAQALRVYSDSFRSQRFQKAEEKAAKIPVKILIPLILFIFPAMFIVILGPAFMRIFKALGGLMQ